MFQVMAALAATVAVAFVITTARVRR
jgi:hypothetical protein